MSTTQPYTLTGRRLTAVPAVPADPLSLPAVGDVFFAVEIEPQGQPAYVSLVNRPPPPQHEQRNCHRARGVAGLHQQRPQDPPRTSPGGPPPGGRRTRPGPPD